MHSANGTEHRAQGTEVRGQGKMSRVSGSGAGLTPTQDKRPKLGSDYATNSQITFHTLPFKIVTKGELIYSADWEAKFNYKEYIINRYRDWKFFIDEFYKGMLESDNRWIKYQSLTYKGLFNIGVTIT